MFVTDPAVAQSYGLGSGTDQNASVLQGGGDIFNANNPAVSPMLNAFRMAMSLRGGGAASGGGQAVGGGQPGGAAGTGTGVTPATQAQVNRFNPYGAPGFLGVNPLSGQPVWSSSVLAGGGGQSDEEKMADLRVAEEIKANPFTYATNPGSTNMYTGEFSPYNPQYAATMDTANRLARLTGGGYAASSFQNPGRNYADTFLGGANAGAIADAIMRYGSINHPVVQGLLRGSQASVAAGGAWNPAARPQGPIPAAERLVGVREPGREPRREAGGGGEGINYDRDYRGWGPAPPGGEGGGNVFGGGRGLAFTGLEGPREAVGPYDPYGRANRLFGFGGGRGRGPSTDRFGRSNPFGAFASFGGGFRRPTANFYPRFY